jgi:hypothetical protein
VAAPVADRAEGEQVVRQVGTTLAMRDSMMGDEQHRLDSAGDQLTLTRAAVTAAVPVSGEGRGSVQPLSPGARSPPSTVSAAPPP